MAVDGTLLYRKVIVVSSFAKRQRNRSSGYHEYQLSRGQSHKVGSLDHKMTTMATTNAAATSLDSKWTPQRDFSGVL